MKRPRALSLSLVALAWAALAIPALARQEAQEPAPEKRPIEIGDIVKWSRTRSATLSDDGRWFAYLHGPGDGDAKLHLRDLQGDGEEKLFDVGGGGRIAFSRDSSRLAFIVTPEGAGGGRGGRRGGGRRGAAPATDAPPDASRRNKVAILNLATMEKLEFEGARGFEFSGESPRFIALQKYAPSGQTGSRGADLVLHDLSGAANDIVIGNVADFTFNKSGDKLAWIVDAQDKFGNGIQLRDMATGAIVALESDRATYRSLGWDEDGVALTALKAIEDDDYASPLHSVVGFRDLDSATPRRVLFDPAAAEGFPEGMTVSPNRAPQWTDDRTGLVFGIHKVEKKEQATSEREPGEGSGARGQRGGQRGGRGAASTELTDDEKPDLVLWHWKDDRLQSQQEVQSGADRNFSFLSVYWIDDDAFVRLATDEIRSATLAPNQHWAIGTDNGKYQRMGSLDGRRYEDVYVIDAKSGFYRLALERSRWNYGPSPDGARFLFYEGGHFHVYDMPTGRKRNVTQGVPTSFIDVEDDHNVVDPPTRQLGWTSDSAAVLLSDDWDIWKVPVNGGEAVNLTVNGRDDAIRYQRFYSLDPDEEGTDLSGVKYVQAYGEWTKKSGIGRITGGEPGVEMLLWEDAGLGGLQKARDADVHLYTRQTFEQPSEYYRTGADLSGGERLTESVPEQSDFLWSAGSRLIDYESAKGDRLQASLHLPADYVEGESYPTIVYIYEKLSQNHHSYATPSANGFNKSVYTSHGYAVLMPDIVYRVDDPGMSSVWCVLPALEAAIATGVVDRYRVGLHGHSWGGYQTSFLVTQTEAFAAAVAGAPLTNMISMYSSVYWNTGGANMAIFESSQGRFSGGYWDVPDAYARNSPVYFAERVVTPLIILHNDRDGAVDWNQGIEYFNTLRRLEKPVVMLQYEGENHGLRKPANQHDYTVRMKEFFDRHLKNAPAPKWLTEGVPRLELDKHIEERTLEIKRAKERAGGGGR